MDAGEERAEINRTVKISITEGMLWQVYATVAAPGSVFLTKFAVMLGATPLQFGLVSAIGQLSQVFQPLGVALTRKMTSRKGVVVALVSAGRAIAFLYGFLPLALSAQAAMWAFLPLFLVATSLQAVGGNAWIGWISDIIPLEIRGRFFARRSQFLMLAGMVTGYLFSAFIDLFATERSGLSQAIVSAVGNAALFVSENLPHAFAALMGFAAVIGLLSARILLLQPERAKAVETESFRAILAEPFRDANFRKLLLYGFWWMLAVGIGGPFWGPFMIKNLGMPLINIQIYGTIQTIAALVALRPWGLLIDRFGNKTAMRLAIFMGGINPVVWIFATPESHWFLYIEAATSGVMWAGAGIVATNFVLAVAPDAKRQIYSGIFGAFSGVAMMVTLLASGAFLPAPMTLLGLRLEPEQILFGLGGVLRWTTQIPLSWVREPRGESVGSVVRYAGQYARTRMARARGRSKPRGD
jgi:hypothetical protein